jgi:hypothetical protein
MRTLQTDQGAPVKRAGFCVTTGVFADHTQVIKETHQF